jgi:hypothetical protein
VRYDGVEVLADPGTYCYHGEPRWRQYFRSTIAHNTIEIDGVDQSVAGGPFLWSSQAVTEVIDAKVGRQPIQRWSARHTGYARLDPTLTHARSVTLRREERLLAIVDELTGSRPHAVRLFFHLGPTIRLVRSGDVAELSWRAPSGPGAALLCLPAQLEWSEHRAETEPVLGWYSPRFGLRRSTTTLVGSGVLAGTLRLTTTLDFAMAELGQGAEGASRVHRP